MLEETRQQPAALEKTLRGELRRLERFKRMVQNRRPRLIVLCARGTSDNAAQFGRYLLEISCGIPVSLSAPSIYSLYNAELDLRDVLVVAISQSGESTDTNLVLERARAKGALTIGITNEASSAMARLADEVLREPSLEEHQELHGLDCLSRHRRLENYEFCREKLAT